MSSIDAGGVDLYYEVSGSGPPLALIMGLGCSARQWQWLMPLLTPSFRVIAFDNRDVGRSGRAAAEYATDQLADDTAALLSALQVKRAHVFGISVGGMIAQKVALRHPHMVERLVLGCTMPGFFHHAPDPEDLERLQMTQVLPPEESAATLMELFFTDRFRSSSPQLCAQIKELLMLEKAEQGPEAFMRQLGAAMTHDTAAEVHNISVPTLVIGGDRDPMAPIENARFLAAQIPDSTLVELAGIRHGFWIERAEEAAALVTGFLNEQR